MVKLVPKSENIKKKLDEIEAEMKHLGMWSKTPPHKEAFEDMGAFGMKTMSFDQWLQFVFVPNVRKLLKTDGPWPAKSEVGIIAVREFDGNPELGNLVALLTEFDMLF